MAGTVVEMNGDGTLTINGHRVTRDEVMLSDGYTDSVKQFLAPLFDESDNYVSRCDL